jgi:hypothetical protein
MDVEESEDIVDAVEAHDSFEPERENFRENFAGSGMFKPGGPITSSM